LSAIYNFSKKLLEKSKIKNKTLKLKVSKGSKRISKAKLPNIIEKSKSISNDNINSP